MRYDPLRISFLTMITWKLLSCSEFNGGSESMGPYADRLDKDSMPEVPVEYLGEIGLELQSTIELTFHEQTPGIGRVDRLIVTSDQSCIFSDNISGEVHEFSLEDGSYIRSFGHHGRGPGEYGRASNIWMSPDDYVFVHDGVSAQILRYDRQGTYLDKTRTVANNIQAVQDGDLLLVEDDWLDRTLSLKKLNPETGQVRYNVRLSTRKNDIGVHARAHLSYHSALNYVYYLGLKDYMIKEIDVTTGKVLRRFGWKAPKFVPFPEKYYTADFDHHENITEALMSSSNVHLMALLDEQYLIVCHTGHEDDFFGIVYDLTATDIITAYSFDRAAVEALFYIGNLSSYKEHLYLHRTPSMETSEVSNGWIELYVLLIP